MAKNQPTLAMKPMIPSTRPITARVPPPSAPPLVEIRWREMNPMIAAAGPSTRPKQMKLQTSQRMPGASAATATPSFPAAAYPADRGPYPPGGGGTYAPPPIGGGG